MTTGPLRPYIKFHGSPLAPWSVPALCSAYSWPTGLAGGGVIGIVELGGGCVHRDIEGYFNSIGQPAPNITQISVDGNVNNNNPTDPDSAEVALDIMVAGASYFMATGHAAHIRVYWAGNTFGAIAASVRAAMRDGCDVFSCSWGADEASWGGVELHRLGNAIVDATKHGMIVLAAAGDNDSSDGGPTPANVDAPASCARAIGCGGTTKVLSSETVWNATPGQASGEGTGGGYSTFFMPPSATWQSGATLGTGRMVPDVAANADPGTGYRIILNGQQIVVGGTSAVAPLYAGLLAACGRKLGFVTPRLWAAQDSFTDIIQGDNGLYRARIGPDPCTGLGSPIGTKISLAVQVGINRARMPPKGAL